MIDVPLRQVSYCQDDPRGNDRFAFICKMGPDAPRKCYVFKSDNQASQILSDMGMAFAKSSQAQGKVRRGRQSAA